MPRKEFPSRPSAKTLLDAISNKCPHCALGLFLYEWYRTHPEIDGATTLHGILEVLADFLDSVPEEQKNEIILTAAQQFINDATELLSRTYKRDPHVHPGCEAVQ